jgi:hypothetical protein
MKSDIFKDQPTIGEGEEEVISKKISNVGILLEWLQTNPTLVMLKKAALYEAENRKRVDVLNRILTRIFRLEKEEALKKLIK